MKRAEMSDERRWQAVLEREAAMDGRFVYAVRSTGIYCRPTCPSRRPRREQVVFFAQPGAAERAGFRACQRCRPGPDTRDNPQAGIVQRACQIIEANSEQAPTLGEGGDLRGYRWGAERKRRLLQQETGKSFEF